MLSSHRMTMCYCQLRHPFQRSTRNASLSRLHPQQTATRMTLKDHVEWNQQPSRPGNDNYSPIATSRRGGRPKEHTHNVFARMRRRSTLTVPLDAGVLATRNLHARLRAIFQQASHTSPRDTHRVVRHRSKGIRLLEQAPDDL
jgi:hypothetical protein